MSKKSFCVEKKKPPHFEMLDFLPSTTAMASRRRISAARFSRATVRSIRQAVAIATELELHSVAVAGCVSVWTIRHSQQEQQLSTSIVPILTHLAAVNHYTKFA
jgi:hypothetical protein